MRSSKFAVLSIISLMLYAIVDFCKNALETVLQVRLIAEAGSYSSDDWAVNAGPCQRILLILSAICLTAFVVGIVIDIFSKHKKSKF